MAASHPLVVALEKRGVEFPEADSGVKRVACWSCHDAPETMDVDTVAGQFYCARCKTSGNVWTYLVGHLDLSAAEANRFLHECGWSGDQVTAAAKTAAELRQLAERRKHGEPQHVEKFLHPEHVYDTHSYVTADDDHVCTVVRYRRRPGVPVGGRLPKSLVYTPSSSGWWICRPTHTGLPVEDAWRQPMPLYGLDYPDRDKPLAMVVIGEENVDALNSYGMIPAYCALDREKARISEHDWSPLAGLNVFLVANASAPERAYIARLAKHLAPIVNAMKVAMPRGETGFDPAEAASRRRRMGGVQGMGHAAVRRLQRRRGHLADRRRAAGRQRPLRVARHVRRAHHHHEPADGVHQVPGAQGAVQSRHPDHPGAGDVLAASCQARRPRVVGPQVPLERRQPAHRNGAREGPMEGGRAGAENLARRVAGHPGPVAAHRPCRRDPGAPGRATASPHRRAAQRLDGGRRAHRHQTAGSPWPGRCPVPGRRRRVRLAVLWREAVHGARP